MTLKHHNSFENENNGKATHSFASRPLIFKLQQEVLKFDDTCVSWSSPTTDLVKKKLNSENRSFENVSIVTFNKYLAFLYFMYLFISFLNLFIPLIELKNIH